MFREKAEEIEKNIPQSYNNFKTVGDTILILFMITGFLMIVSALFSWSSYYDNIWETAELVFAIITMFVGVFNKFLFYAAADVVKNTYLSARYAKLQTEMNFYKMAGRTFSEDVQDTGLSSDGLPEI